jgi:hypothetical protein
VPDLDLPILLLSSSVGSSLFSIGAGSSRTDDRHERRKSGYRHVLGQPREDHHIVSAGARQTAVWVAVPFADVFELAASPVRERLLA